MQSMVRSERREFLTLWVLSCVLLLGGIVITRAYLMDDALITLRYSFNLARHGHAIWNQADAADPSLGYTTVLWMLLNALPAFFTDNKDCLVLFSKLIGLAPLAGIALLLVGRVRRMTAPFPFRLAVVAAIFSQVLYGFHLNSGMETLLFSFLILLSVISYAQDVRSPSAPAFGTLAFLTRPEGAIVVALMLLWDLRRGRARQAAAGCVCFSIAFLSLGLILYASYGTVLPNAFYVKQQYASFESLKQTLKFFAAIALPYVPLAAFSAYRLKDSASRYCWHAALVYSTYFLTVRPLMNTFSRYQWPILVLLTYASLPALQMLGESRTERKRLAVAALLAVLLVNVRSALAANRLAASGGTEIRNLIALGKAMAKQRDGSRWLAYCGVGAVCYYSDWNTYDTMGLNTRQIAVGSVGPMEVYGYLNTDLVLLNWGDDPDVMRWRDCDALGTQLRRLGYRYAGSAPIVTGDSSPHWGVALFARTPARATAVLQEVQISPAMSMGRPVRAPASRRASLR